MKQNQSKILYSALLFFMVLLTFQIGAQSVFQKSPYLIFNHHSNSMTLLWQRSGDAVFETIISHGQKQENSQVQYLDNGMCKVDFVNLDYFTSYQYQVSCGSEIKKGSFTSRANESKNSFIFYAYGDTRTYPDSHNLVAKQINLQLEKNPLSQTFIVSTGDVVANGNQEADWQKQFFDPNQKEIQQMLAHLPYMVSMGNHEGQGQLFGQYFPYDFIDSTRYYYSFKYGNAHFIAVDQFTDLSKQSKQYQWLENELKNSTSQWKIVLLHKPGFAAAGHSNDKVVAKILQPLFEKYGVELVLAGHNHYYSRAEVNGVTHIVAGGGGAPLYNPKPSKRHIITADKSHHFCKIEISESKMVIEAIRKDGSIIEHFEIKP